MMFIDEIYQKAITENEKYLQFWESHLNGLKSLQLNVYADKLKVPTLVPIGNRIFFRGELKHTNEVTVALGADYFVKCSIAQAEVLRQHRIKDAQSKVDLYRKEKEHLEKQISFSKQNIYEKDGQEILEVYSDEQEKEWREKHRENVRKYKQGKAKEEPKPKEEITDEELWERLEELELQEELENEMLDNYNEIVDNRTKNTFIVNEEHLLRNSFKEESNKLKTEDIDNNEFKVEVKTNEHKDIDHHNIKESSKLDLLQKVLDKQNSLENKLHELKYREREQSKTEQDLIARLDEMEQLDELEDEIERLDDILETEDVETEDESLISEDDSTKSQEGSTKSECKILRKSISFADEDDSETINITFKHGDIEPNTDSYNPEKGISKPSDLYEAYSNLFDSKTTSILKKSKYGTHIEQAKPEVKPAIKKTKQVMFEEDPEAPNSPEPNETPEAKTIVIKDVVENVRVNQHNIAGGARPTSLFKKRRMQNKF